MAPAVGGIRRVSRVGWGGHAAAIQRCSTGCRFGVKRTGLDRTFGVGVSIRQRWRRGLRHEHQLSRRRRLLEQLVRAAGIGQRQALGHYWVNLVRTKQLEQRPEVFPEAYS